MEVCLEQEKALALQKGYGNPTTNPLNVRRDLIGSLGQNGIIDVFNRYGMQGGLELTPYYDPSIHKDEYDFLYRGHDYDVKSTIMKKFKAVANHSAFLVSDRQMNKRVGSYCFAMVDLDNNLIHYAGVITYEKFWQIAQQAGEWAKSPAHIVEARDLQPLGEIIV